MRGAGLLKRRRLRRFPVGAFPSRGRLRPAKPWWPAEWSVRG